MGYTKTQREAKAKRLAEETKLATPKEEQGDIKEVVTDTTIIETPKEPIKKIAKKIPLDLIVPIISNFVGGLIYKSKKQAGYIIEWDELGGIEYMVLNTLWVSTITYMK